MVEKTNIGTAATTVNMDDSAEDANIAQAGSTHEEFAEVDEVKGLITSLATVYNDQIPMELAVEKFTCMY